MRPARPMVRALLILLVLAVLAGCASTRTQEMRSFPSVGYSGLLDEAHGSRR